MELKFMSSDSNIADYLPQTNDIQIYTCRYLAWHLALLGYEKEQLNKEDQSSTIEIFTEGSIPHAITSANLDVHRCV